MIIFKEIVTFQTYLSEAIKNGTTIGFVTTMGTLHEGHLSLLKPASHILDAPDFHIDYLIMADAHTLPQLEEMDGYQKLVGQISGYQQDVRLIDNIILTD